MSETKYVSNASAWNYFNSTIQGTNQWVSALPVIRQGDDAFQRIGDALSVKRLNTKIAFRFNIADLPPPLQKVADARDISIVIYYGFVKKYKRYDDISSNSADLCNTLLDNGDGTTSSFSGAYEDMLKPVNKDSWILKRKIVRLFKGQGYANTDQSASLVGQALYPPALCSRMVTLRFKGKDKVKYAPTITGGTAPQYPDNYAPVWTCAFIYNDQVITPETGTPTPVQYLARNECWFKDM